MYFLSCQNYPGLAEKKKKKSGPAFLRVSALDSSHDSGPDLEVCWRGSIHGHRSQLRDMWVGSQAG